MCASSPTWSTNYATCPSKTSSRTAPDRHPPVPRLLESGGTTGAPKRCAQLPDWIEQNTRWQTEDFIAGGFVADEGLLCLMPSGPHGVGHFDRVVAERPGAVFHPIDLDPR
jgi:hypothetical protein